jgi:molybdopterin molybdotransferase
MINVEEAEIIVRSKIKDYGKENIEFDLALGRVLAENLYADRDLPPFNRVTVDGIAINFDAFAKGIRSFRIKATQGAGNEPIDIATGDECIEIMTGASLPETTDTVIRYEDIEIKKGVATIRSSSVKKRQNLHEKGSDKIQHEVVAKEGRIITAGLISLAASVGKTILSVKRLPRAVIITSGNELIGVNETPTKYQIRTSNIYATQAVLRPYGLLADILRIPDDPEIIECQIDHCLRQYEVILLSGGVSMGKFDYIPKILEALAVTRLFHQVRQRPGKPFWFGSHSNGVLVFAFPGNPVSTFLCLHRYFLPWLTASLGYTSNQYLYAILNEDFTFTDCFQYFLLVILKVNPDGQLRAIPTQGNGSGDFVNLGVANGFMELPMDRHNFMKGEVFKVWPFNCLNHIFTESNGNSGEKEFA